MRIAAAQMRTRLLDRDAGLDAVGDLAGRAAGAGARVVAFPETCVPGYPTWLARTGGAAFDDPDQKALQARYLEAALELPGPGLERLRAIADGHGVSLVVGVAERLRGSLFATALWVHPDGRWQAHRKLVPTYEERLAWAPGDGAGLGVQTIEGWRCSVLNCWENWMPLARAALYGEGTEVHFSLWPGSPSLTRDISRFTAREGRVYVCAASGVLRTEDLPADLQLREQLQASAPDGLLHRGGSRIVAPDGVEVAVADEPDEELLYADLDRAMLYAERQNFDPAGHYSRPDVFEFEVDRRRLLD